MNERSVYHFCPTAELYLDLLKKCLTRFILGENYQWMCPDRDTLGGRLWGPIERLLARKNLWVMRRSTFDPDARKEGRDWPWPVEAETMIGLVRLDNLHECIKKILLNGIVGDLIECGVWRGGATIFMRAALAAYGDDARIVWVAD
jgi:O-methyltransferase